MADGPSNVRSNELRELLSQLFSSHLNSLSNILNSAIHQWSSILLSALVKVAATYSPEAATATMAASSKISMPASLD